MCEVRASLAGSIRGATVAVNRDPATLLARIRAGIGSKRDQLKGLAVEPGCKMGQYELLVTLRVGNYTVKPRRSTIETLRVSGTRSEEHTSELQSRGHLVCRLLLET